MIVWSRYKTRFGDGAVVCLDDRILRVCLPSREMPVSNLVTGLFPGEDLQETRRDFPAECASELGKFFEGSGTPTDLVPVIEWPDCRDFKRRILEACATIPRGSVVTYIELAREAGYPKWRNYGQAVGQVMSTNPLPLVIPCHRVLSAGYSLGNYGGGSEMKRWLLEREGCAIN